MIPEAVPELCEQTESLGSSEPFDSSKVSNAMPQRVTHATVVRSPVFGSATTESVSWFSVVSQLSKIPPKPTPRPQMTHFSAHFDTHSHALPKTTKIQPKSLIPLLLSPSCFTNRPTNCIINCPTNPRTDPPEVPPKSPQSTPELRHPQFPRQVSPQLPRNQQLTPKSHPNHKLTSWLTQTPT